MRPRLAHALLLLLLTACIDPPSLETRRVRARSVAGCYSLEVDLFAPQAAASIRPFDGLSRLRLTTDSLSPQKPELYRAQALNARGDSILTSYPLRLWYVGESTDSVVVVLSHGFGGLSLALRPREDSLVGDALVFGDIEPYSERVGRARAARTACPREPRGRVRGGAG